MQAYSSFSAVFVERSGNSCRSFMARFLFNVEKQISTATVNLRKNKEESDEGEDERRRRRRAIRRRKRYSAVYFS